MGIQPSAIRAVAATLLPLTLAQKIGTSGRTGWLMIFSGLPSPVPCPGGNGTCTVGPSYTTGSRRKTIRQTLM